MHQVWEAVKAHCRANQSEHAIREWAIFFRPWEAGLAQQQAEQEGKASLHALVRRLPKRLRRVIRRRYGLVGEKRQTLAEVGRELGVCSERVRQLQVEALVWLRHPAHSQELRQLLARHSQQEYEWAEEAAKPGCAVGQGVMARPEQTRTHDPDFVSSCSFSALQDRLPLRWPTPVNTPSSPKIRYRSGYQYLGWQELADPAHWEDAVISTCSCGW